MTIAAEAFEEVERQAVKQGVSKELMSEAISGIESPELISSAAANLQTAKSAGDFTKDVVQKGVHDAKNILRNMTEAGNLAAIEPASAAMKAAAADADVGIAGGVADLVNAGSVSAKGGAALADVAKTIADDTIAPTLRADLKTAPSWLEKIMTGVRDNYGKLLVAGVTSTVVIMWLATGHGLQDLFDAVENIVSETSKNLIGALAGIAHSLTDPLGKSLGSIMTTVGIVVAVLAGVALLGYGIYMGVKKSKEAKNK